MPAKRKRLKPQEDTLEDTVEEMKDRLHMTPVELDMRSGRLRVISVQKDGKEREPGAVSGPVPKSV